MIFSYTCMYSFVLKYICVHLCVRLSTQSLGRSFALGHEEKKKEGYLFEFFVVHVTEGDGAKPITSHFWVGRGK